MHTQRGKGSTSGTGKCKVSQKLIVLEGKEARKCSYIKLKGLSTGQIWGILIIKEK